MSGADQLMPGGCPDEDHSRYYREPWELKRNQKADTKEPRERPHQFELCLPRHLEGRQKKT